MLIRNAPSVPSAPTGPSVPPIGSVPGTLAELYGCVYGGQTDYLTGAAVPYRTDGYFQAPYAQHDVSPLPGESGSPFDWQYGATKQGWPTDSTWSNAPYENAWNHGWLASTERRCYFQFTDPQIYFGSTLQAYPDSNTDIWSEWCSRYFNFLPSVPVTKSRQTTTGGTPYWSIDMSTSTPANGYFMHSAWDYYDSRMYVPPGTIVSIQWWARMVPFTGVAGSTIVLLAGGAGDRYFSTTDPGGPSNPAFGIPRYKKLPTDSTWRLMGYTSDTSAHLLSSPPPIISAPS